MIRANEPYVRRKNSISKMSKFSMIELKFGMTIESALFTESQIRLYVWLFGDPNRSYHLSELRRLTELGSASLQRELKRLVEADLIESEAVGNLRRFQANRHSPVFAELVSLTRKTLGVVPELRDALEALKPSPLGAWIYGSVAKQTDTASSDIDLMVVGDDLLLGEVLAALEPTHRRLERVINPTLYSMKEFERRLAEPDSFVNRVLAQPIMPVMGDLHERH